MTDRGYKHYQADFQRVCFTTSSKKTCCASHHLSDSLVYNWHASLKTQSGPCNSKYETTGRSTSTVEPLPIIRNQKCDCEQAEQISLI